MFVGGYFECFHAIKSPLDILKCTKKEKTSRRYQRFLWWLHICSLAQQRGSTQPEQDAGGHGILFEDECISGKVEESTVHFWGNWGWEGIGQLVVENVGIWMRNGGGV